MSAWLAGVFSMMGAIARTPPPPRLDFTSRIAELQRAHYDTLYAQALAQYQAEATPKPVIRAGKCPSCGSREFVEHRGQTVCSYCRGGA